MVRTAPGTRLLDVRTPGEFASVHIPGAYNVPLDILAEHALEIRSVGDAQLVLVCQSGNRARQADSALRSLGMANLHLLDGGMIAWQAAGMTVNRGEKRMSLERQVRITAGGISAIGAILALTVNPLIALVPAIVGSGLVFAGLTDTCAMGMLLARLPYNRGSSCDVGAMARALSAGSSPPLAGINAATSSPSS
ncbi:MAG: rhodanese-like domain-containing protein [Gemmatimonadota bacterium]|nr:rhodanese-like domain-containing protein [Gemmatimonadota bacterium]